MHRTFSEELNDHGEIPTDKLHIQTVQSYRLTKVFQFFFQNGSSLSNVVRLTLEGTQFLTI